MLQLAVLTLTASLAACAAGVSPRTMAAVVSVESGGWPLTIHDNTADRSYTFRDRRRAVSTADALLTAHHNIDLGLAQINSSNLRALGLTPATIFDPCTNVRAGAAILAHAYVSAVNRFGAGQAALRFALSAYNSGSLFAAPQYAPRGRGGWLRFMKRRRLGGPIALTLAALFVMNLALIAAYAAGLRLNATASMPEGVYRLARYDGEAIARGTVVAICPSSGVVALAAARHYLQSGPCPGEVEPLLKHVAATAGDLVTVSDREVSVNGSPLPHSARLERDCAGRPLARLAPGRYPIASNTVWLYAPVARSWDSRYFGPQRVSGIVGIATPIFIVGNGPACGS